MKAIDRVYEYLGFKGVKPIPFEKKIGLSNGYLGKQLKRKANLGEEILNKIIENCPEINPIWLLTGKGEMLCNLKANHKLNEPPEVYSVTKGKGIPFVDTLAIGGFGGSDFAIEERDVKAYYVIPKFKGRKIDFMIEVSGSSMYPKYNSGDVVACRIIKESNFIQWNKVHVIATEEQGILIKRLRKSEVEDTLWAISDNESYDPFLLPTNEMKGIAIVVGVIRLE